VANKVHAVVGRRVADGIFEAIAVGLIEEVSARSQDYGARRAEAVLLARLGRHHLADFVTMFKVAALRNADR
jgi:hypothetical protein